MKDDDQIHNHGHGDEHGHGHDRKPHPEPPALFVDNESFHWDEKTITGKQLRVLASVPDDVQIFHKVPGKPDQEVKDNTPVDLTKVPGPDHFSTQPVRPQPG
jgi:hypothetical protein